MALEIKIKTLKCNLKQTENVKQAERVECARFGCDVLLRIFHAPEGALLLSFIYWKIIALAFSLQTSWEAVILTWLHKNQNKFKILSYQWLLSIPQKDHFIHTHTQSHTHTQLQTHPQLYVQNSVFSN